jgi:hypothetical protein
MTVNEGPRQGLWIEVPATSSAEDLARVVDASPRGLRGAPTWSTWTCWRDASRSETR